MPKRLRKLNADVTQIFFFLKHVQNMLNETVRKRRKINNFAKKSKKRNLMKIISGNWLMNECSIEINLVNILSPNIRQLKYVFCTYITCWIFYLSIGCLRLGTYLAYLTRASVADIARSLRFYLVYMFGLVIWV